MSSDSRAEVRRTLSGHGIKAVRRKVRRYGVNDFAGLVGMAIRGKPSYHEKRPFLRHPNLVAARPKPFGQLSQAWLREEVAVEVLPLRAGRTRSNARRQLQLVGLQRACRLQFPGCESARDHFWRGPHRHGGHRLPTANDQPASQHALQHADPFVHLLAGAFPGGRIAVALTRRERSSDLERGVARIRVPAFFSLLVS
jgi:hypothetical protein